MALHPSFPASPYAALIPEHRWFPTAEESGQPYDFVFVDQTIFDKHAPKTFAGLSASFTEYKHTP